MCVDPVTKFYADEGLYCGWWKNVCFQIWSGDATEARLKQLRDMFVARAKSGPVLVLTRLEVSTKMYKVHPEAKPIIADISERFSGQTVVSVQVVEAGGFVGAAARAVLITIGKLQRAKTHTVASMDAAVGLLLPQANGAFTREALLAAAAEARVQWQTAKSVPVA